MRISDWSSDVCSSDLTQRMARIGGDARRELTRRVHQRLGRHDAGDQPPGERLLGVDGVAGEGHLAGCGVSASPRQEIGDPLARNDTALDEALQIGTASCWTRVCPYVKVYLVAVSL